MKKYVFRALLTFVTLTGFTANAHAGNWLIGSGIHDITGPSADAIMVGYGEPNQVNKGIHARLWSRAYVVSEESTNPKEAKRIVFVSADLSHIPQGVKQGVMRRLKEKYPGIYNNANVMLSATHTHTGPGNYNHHTLLNTSFNVAKAGFDRRHYNSIVDGIVKSIIRASDNMTPGHIYINKTNLLGASVNRNPDPYSSNPDAGQYAHKTNKRMLLLKFVDDKGNELGTVNWFAVHNVSYSSDKKTISGDNKGLASYLFEKHKKTNYRADKTFVAAFASSNLGDVSPNVCGPQNGCAATETDAALLSATRQFNTAQKLYDTARRRLLGKMYYRHQYVYMPGYKVEDIFTGTGTESVCDFELGKSFGAGSLWDGPSGNGGTGAIADPSQQEHCHYPKVPLVPQWVSDILPYIDLLNLVFPVLPIINIGLPPGLSLMAQSYLDNMYPRILPFQIFVLGELAIVSAPSEMTTMAGRRLEAAVQKELSSIGVKDVVIAGLANAYSGYVTTPEEYDWQRYEGGHTIFGPNTLPAYLQIYTRLSKGIATNTFTAHGPNPPDLLNHQWLSPAPVLYDDKYIWEYFGQVIHDANDHYEVGRDHVKVVFRSGHPKNNYQHQGSFFNIERRVNGKWQRYLTDNELTTQFHWRRDSRLDCPACSFFDGFWTPGPETPSGTYRMVHYGYWKSGFTGATSGYAGYSRSFFVSNPVNRVSFKTHHGTYLSAINNGGANVRANAPHSRTWEKFNIIHIEDNLPVADPSQCIRHGAQVAIRTDKGNYFMATPNGKLRAKERHVRAWERFTLFNHTDTTGCLDHNDSISLRSNHGRFVVAENYGEANANRPSMGPWERFTVKIEAEPNHQHIHIPPKHFAQFRTSHGTYLRAEEFGNLIVNANSTTAGSKETFGVVLLEDFLPVSQHGQCIRHGSRISLRASDFHYVIAKNLLPYANGTLHENNAAFELINHTATNRCWQSGDVISLRSVDNLYLVAEPNRIAYINRPAIGPWERFTVTF